MENVRRVARLVVAGSALLLSLAGCANYSEKLNPLLGATESSLLAQWGPPTNIFESGGVRYLTYSKSSSRVIPGAPPNYQTMVHGNTASTTPAGGTSPDVVNFSCTTTFTVQDGVIKSYRWQGDDCY